jgi:glutathione S-transferase
MSTLTLYAPGPATVPVIGCSPPSWMVRLALEEKELPYTLRALSFAAGEHRSEAMRALSPKGTIPVLTDGDAVLTETFAILVWLELAHPDPSMLGESAAGRARALDLFHASLPVKTAGMALLAGRMRDVDAAGLTERAAAFAGALSPFEAALRDAPWAAGDLGPTLADLTLFTYFVATRRLALVASRDFPALDAHAERMRARASVQATWPFEA